MVSKDSVSVPDDLDESYDNLMMKPDNMVLKYDNVVTQCDHSDSETESNGMLFKKGSKKRSPKDMIAKIDNLLAKCGDMFVKCDQLAEKPQVTAKRQKSSEYSFDLENLTLADIGDHNSTHRMSGVWVPLHGYVYDFKRLTKLMSPVIKAKLCDESLVYRGDYCIVSSALKYSASSYMYILTVCKMLKVNPTMLHEAMKLSKIGSVKTLTPDELVDEYRIHNSIVIEALTSVIQQQRCDSNSSINEYLLHYLTTFRTNCQLQQEKLLICNISNHPVSGDINNFPFPLVNWINPDDLRPYVYQNRTYIDTALEGCAWQELESCKVDLGDVDQYYTKGYLRDWLNDWEGFDMEISSDTVWQVLESDVIKQDKVTKDQEMIISLREERKELWDTRKMESRRNRIFKYFAKKYGYSKSQLASYRGWARRLEEHEKLLHDLS